MLGRLDQVNWDGVNTEVNKYKWEEFHRLLGQGNIEV